MPEWQFIMSQYIPGKEGLMIMNDPHTGWCPAVRSDFYFSKANKDCWYSWHKPPQLRQQADSITYNATIAAWLVEEFPEKVGEIFIGSTGLLYPLGWCKMTSKCFAFGIWFTTLVQTSICAPFFTFPYIGNNSPNWRIFFRGVETTKQMIVLKPTLTCTGPTDQRFHVPGCDPGYFRSQLTKGKPLQIPSKGSH